MNTIISFIKRLFSNLICVALLVVAIVSWKAAGVYKANQSKILAMENSIEQLRQRQKDIANKIRFHAQRKDELKAKIIRNGADIQWGNIRKSCQELTDNAVLYIQKDIDYCICQKNFIDVFAKLYLEEKKLVLAKGQTYLNFWEKEFRSHWFRYFITAALTVFLTPFLIAFIMYYAVAFWVERRKADIALAGISLNDTILKQADARVQYILESGRRLYLRAGWCKERKNTITKTKFLWQWKYPLVSFASDLCELVEFSASGTNHGEVLITAPIEDLFIGKVELNGGELIMRPRFLIGVTDNVLIRTHWDFSVHSIFSGRIRKIILYGNGTVFLAGSWGIDQRAPKNGEDYRIESKMLLGYDSGAHYSLCRTETFWHYFRGKADLFDIKISKGLFLTQNNAWSAMKAPRNNVEAVFKFFFDGVFSILGL